MPDNIGDTHSVRKLYDRYPYPSARPGAQPIFDTAMGLEFVVSDLAGRKVLDAGCGTGHRLVGMALQFPETSFVGLDFSGRSLSVAGELAAAYECANVELVQGEIGSVSLGGRFDLVTCTGVIHHLEDPAGGAQWLAGQLTPDGIIYSWLYHRYGEYYRLLDRRLVRLLTRHTPGVADAGIVRELQIAIEQNRYGISHSPSPASSDTQAAVADAYCHPIVNTYRFREAAALFGLKMDWVTVSGINWPDGSRLVSLADWGGEDRSALTAEDMFGTDRLQALFERLDPASQLDCVELRIRPTGFTLVGGKSAGLSWCRPRIKSNAALANLGQGGAD